MVSNVNLRASTARPGRTANGKGAVAFAPSRGKGKGNKRGALVVRAAGNTFGRLFRVTTFGESHGGGVGCVVDGVPPRLVGRCNLLGGRKRPGSTLETAPCAIHEDPGFKPLVSTASYHPYSPSITQEELQFELDRRRPGKAARAG